MDNKNLTLGSLFDGSGGFPLGGLLAGITPLWASEIEPFPIRVTTKRLPFVKHLGDINKIHGNEIEPVDIITFGSPCTDMSVAGKRAGLDGSQSCLFYEAVRIIKEMRCATHGKYPRYIVWENVPGAFSSNKGEDFKAVLESVCRIADETVSVPSVKKWQFAGSIVGDGYSVAWRVLDAQYWGVPQRRKRIYLVADFTGGSAGKILFESEDVSGYSAEGFKSWKGAAGGAEDSAGAAVIGFDRYNGDLTYNVAQSLTASAGSSGDNQPIVFQKTTVLNDQGGSRMDVTEDVTCTLRAEVHHPPVITEKKSAGFCTEHSAQSRSIGYEEEKSPTLRTGAVPAAVMFENHSQDTRYTGPLDTAPTVSSNYGTGGNNQPFVVETPKTLKIRSGCGVGAAAVETQKVYSIGNSSYREEKVSRTLDAANCGNPSCNQGGMVVLSVQGSMIGRKDANGPQGGGVNEDVSFTLNTTDKHAVAYGIDRATYNMGQNAKYSIAIEEELDPTMVARGRGAVAHPAKPTDSVAYCVRRLTPTECARLQGFPDWWCDDIGMENPTDEELAFWREVFTTYAGINGGKAKSDKQILKWLKEPQSDSAEYKMWGNGVALPNVYFVLTGIAWAAKQPDE